jgi:hypothetical protein
LGGILCNYTDSFRNSNISEPIQRFISLPYGFISLASGFISFKLSLRIHQLGIEEEQR